VQVFRHPLAAGKPVGSTVVEAMAAIEAQLSGPAIGPDHRALFPGGRLQRLAVLLRRRRNRHCSPDFVWPGREQPDLKGIGTYIQLKNEKPYYPLRTQLLQRAES
jgi:hypothetical protein